MQVQSVRVCGTGGYLPANCRDLFRGGRLAGLKIFRVLFDRTRGNNGVCVKDM